MNYSLQTHLRGPTIAYLVTGAAGFIGSNLVRHLLGQGSDTEVVALDALTYSGHLESLEGVLDDPRLTFVRGDIRSTETLREVFAQHTIDGVFHLAAESHVDRSIDSPMDFVTTNVQGTVALLGVAGEAWAGDPVPRFHHVSTDEVFGTLGMTGSFSESTPYSPRSPYAASKAASDHFVRAWAETYGLNIVITNCTNNYGPYQFPEKLIPVVVERLTRRQPIPVYGDGQNVRDWLYVRDHCIALTSVYAGGRSGETYCIGGEAESSNLALVEHLCEIYDDVAGNAVGDSRSLIEFVADRPGHDFRYAMDISKIREDLDWSPSVDLEMGLRHTVEWYLDNQEWVRAVSGDEHATFQERWYRR